jgi:hypothetical protein
MNFGTAEDYTRALGTVIGEGLPVKHLHLLRAHCEAPKRKRTNDRLAKAVGYANYRAANLQYGRLAHRVATELGVRQKPNGFWLFVLVDWAHGVDRLDPKGHTYFVLREPVVEALRRLGYTWARRTARRVGKPWETVVSASEWSCAACRKPIPPETPFLLHPDGEIAKHKQCPTVR